MLLRLRLAQEQLRLRLAREQLPLRLVQESNMTPVTDNKSDARISSITPSEKGGGKSSSRHVRRIKIFGALILAAIVAGVLIFPSAWHETQLREAYLPELEKIARAHPYDSRILTLLAVRQDQAEAYSEAAGTYFKAISTGDNRPQVWLAWAASEAAAGRKTRSLVVLREGAVKCPQGKADFEAAWKRVQALGSSSDATAVASAICPAGIGPLAAEQTHGSYLNFISLWTGKRHPTDAGFATREHLARDNPENLQFQTLWGEALVRNRRFAEAHRTLQAVVEKDPKNAEAHLALGDALKGRGDFGKAGLEYIAALHVKPNWLPALIGVGNVAVERQILPMAVSALQRAVKQDPRSAEAWIGLGRAYYNQRLHLDLALDAFQKAAQLAPDQTDFYPDYSNALRANYKYDEAEAILRCRLQSTPQDARSHYLLGLLILDNKPTLVREAEAEKELRESLRLEPNVSATCARLGRQLLSAGNKREAQKLLERSLELDPSNVTAMLALAKALVANGQLAEAAQMRTRAVQMGEYTQRIATLEDRLNRDPTNKSLHLQAADAYEAGGEPDKAHRHREMAYLLETHKKEAEKGLNMLRDATLTAPPTAP